MDKIVERKTVGLVVWEWDLEESKRMCTERGRLKRMEGSLRDVRTRDERRNHEGFFDYCVEEIGE